MGLVENMRPAASQELNFPIRTFRISNFAAADPLKQCAIVLLLMIRSVALRAMIARTNESKSAMQETISRIDLFEYLA